MTVVARRHPSTSLACRLQGPVPSFRSGRKKMSVDVSKILASPLALLVARLHPFDKSNI